MTTRCAHTLLSLSLMLAAGAAWAGELTVPNDFQAGERALAADVNENFDEVEIEVTDNDRRITGAQGTADAAAAAAQNAADTAVGVAVDVALNASDLNALETALIDLEARLAELEPRFQACSDGLTVADTETGLLWERKTGTSKQVAVDCRAEDCLDRHDVNNMYQAFDFDSDASDGNAYTDFLVDLNAGSGFAGHTDWRLPFISEWQSILVGPAVLTVATPVPAEPSSGLNVTGQALQCYEKICVDHELLHKLGMTSRKTNNRYWSASFSVVGDGTRASRWGVVFRNNSGEELDPRVFVTNSGAAGDEERFVIAVRTGSCVD